MNPAAKFLTNAYNARMHGIEQAPRLIVIVASSALFDDYRNSLQGLTLERDAPARTGDPYLFFKNARVYRASDEEGYWHADVFLID